MITKEAREANRLRDEEIYEKYCRRRDAGFKWEEAMNVLAKEYFLAPGTIKHIVHVEKHRRGDTHKILPYADMLVRDEEMLTLANSGVSNNDLAKKYFITPSRVSQVVNKKRREIDPGYMPPPYAPPKDPKKVERNRNMEADFLSGLSNEQLCRKYRLAPSTVDTVLKEAIIKRNNKIYSEYELGVSEKDICARYHMPLNTLRRILNKKKRRKENEERESKIY